MQARNQHDSAVPEGASADAFAGHRGYQRLFRAQALTLGVFLPLRRFAGAMEDLAGMAGWVEQIDRAGFGAVWLRDIPLWDPEFGDAGQVFDPFVYLAYLAARTRDVALATGSAIFSLRHPIDLAKSAASIDQLSQGRLILGAAAGDRPREFPAYGVDPGQRPARYAQALADVRYLLSAESMGLDSPLGRFRQARLLPKPWAARIPILTTGHAGQSLSWLGRHADGWLTYPGRTDDDDGPRQLGARLRAWRDTIPDGGFRPHVTNEWLDLSEDPAHPRQALQGGFVLRTGRHGLIELLQAWREAGVNHAALGIQYGRRPPGEVLQELAEEVLPEFASHS